MGFEDGFPISTCRSENWEKFSNVTFSGGCTPEKDKQVPTPLLEKRFEEPQNQVRANVRYFHAEFLSTDGFADIPSKGIFH